MTGKNNSVHLRAQLPFDLTLAVNFPSITDGNTLSWCLSVPLGECCSPSCPVGLRRNPASTTHPWDSGCGLLAVGVCLLLDLASSVLRQLWALGSCLLWWTWRLFTLVPVNAASFTNTEPLPAWSLDSPGAESWGVEEIYHSYSRTGTSFYTNGTIQQCRNRNNNKQKKLFLCYN